MPAKTKRCAKNSQPGRSHPINNILYLLIKNLAVSLARLFFNPRVEGRENIPEKGPFIVAPNHTSLLDPVVVQSALPAKIYWIAKRSVYENPCLKFINYISGTIPMNGAVDKALSALKEGRVLGIFPEGGLSPDGRPKEANPGVAILALKSGESIVPIGIKGAYEAFPPGRKIFKPHPIVVKIGKPFSFERIDEEVIDGRLINETKDFVMERIKELLI